MSILKCDNCRDESTIFFFKSKRDKGGLRGCRNTKERKKGKPGCKAMNAVMSGRSSIHNIAPRLCENTVKNGPNF